MAHCEADIMAGPIGVTLARPVDTDRVAFAIKWAASIVQILGYSATALDLAPWNVYLFLVGLVGWFVAGILWKERAIMLIHLVAPCAMLVGLMS